jgi:hypothetical protein
MKLKTGFYCRSTCFHNVALLFIYCSKNSLPRAVLHILHSTETGTNNVVCHKNACYLSWWWPLPATPEHQMYQTTFHNNPGNNTAIKFTLNFWSTCRKKKVRPSPLVLWTQTGQMHWCLIIQWDDRWQNSSPERKTCWMLLYLPKILGLNFSLHS